MEIQAKVIIFSPQVMKRICFQIFRLLLLYKISIAGVHVQHYVTIHN